MERNRQTAVIAASAILLASANVEARWVCWSSDQAGRIECAQLDGTGRHSLVISDGKPMGMAVDADSGRLFWAERDSERVMSSPLSGRLVFEPIVQLPFGAGLRGMAVAPSIGKVYWVAEAVGTIQRANLDGTNVETLPVGGGSFFDVQVDDAAGVLYWTDGTEIWRGNLDGTSGAPIIGDTDQPYYLALDMTAGKLYWTDFARNEIGRANLDGTGREIPAPITGLADRPVGVAVDRTTNKIYWTLEGGDVQRADLDGSAVETIVASTDSAWDIVIVETLPAAGGVPTVSTWGAAALALCLLSVGTLLVRRQTGATW